MCLSCGCDKPNDDHGNKDNITMSQLEKAAKASDISVAEAAQNIQQGAQKHAKVGHASSARGQRS